MTSTAARRRPFAHPIMQEDARELLHQLRIMRAQFHRLVALTSGSTEAADAACAAADQAITRAEEPG